LKIEYAHYILGVAEAKRLCGDPQAAAGYQEAYKLYKETGVLWGIVRASVGLSMLAQSDRKLDQLLKGLHIRDPIDADFISRAHAGRIDKSEILFLNMP
jgi:hypothetical protein